MKKSIYLFFFLILMTFGTSEVIAQIATGTVKIGINCEPGKVNWKNANGILECVTEVKFYKWYDKAGFNLATAQDICQKNDWLLATAEQVTKAHSQKLLDQLAYGMLADGSFAVPVQNDYNFFKKGANIGAIGGNEGFFYVAKSVVPNPPKVDPSGINGGSLNINTTGTPAVFYAPEGAPKPIVSVQMSHCSASNANNSELSKVWLTDWPSSLSINSTSSINIMAAKTYFERKGFPVTDQALEQLVASLKIDPVTRYKFAPFLLEQAFEALVTPSPNAAQSAYKGAFQEYQSCVDYTRAVITRDLWETYQGQGTFGGPRSYAPNLISNTRFQHRPSADRFMESDPAQYGPIGGEAVALLFMPMAVNAGVLADHPSIEQIQSMDDDLTGIALAAGIGTAAASATAIVGGTAALMTVVGAKVTAAVTSAAAANLAIAKANLAYVMAQPIATGGAQVLAQAGAQTTAKVAVQTATTALTKAAAGVSKTFLINIGNLAGPVMVAVMAAAILGMTAAQVAKTDAYEAKVRAAATRAYDFRVSEFLNVPEAEREIRRNALFVNVVKHLIANPAERGQLTIELPPVFPKDVLTAPMHDKKFGELASTSVTTTTPPAATVMTPASPGYVRIQNSWKTNNYIHNQNGKIEEGSIKPNWWSSQWKIVPGRDGWVYIQNKWKPTHHLHNQNGKIEQGVHKPGWWSSQWKLVPTHSGWVRIQNRWKPNHYLHNQNGKIEVGPIDNNWASALWKVK